MTKKKLRRILAIESVLIELTTRKEDDPAWSSRVQAERLYKMARGKTKERVKKPWEHFAIGEVPNE
jgi:hypothetical protein